MYTSSRTFLVGLAVIGCGGNQATPVDAAADAAPIADAGLFDFSCVGVPSPTITTVDPILIDGVLLRQPGDPMGTALGGVSIEVRAVDGDTLLDQTTSAADGSYAASLKTGGIAQKIYRKIAATTDGYLPTYIYDPVAEFSGVTDCGGACVYFEETQATTTFFDQLVGLTPDPTKGNAIIEISDCGAAGAEHAVSGVSIVAPAGARVVYTGADGTVGTLTATSSRGEIGVFGVTPGELDIVIQAGSVTYRSWPVQIFAGSWTYSARKP